MLTVYLFSKYGVFYLWKFHVFNVLFSAPTHGSTTTLTTQSVRLPACGFLLVFSSPRMHRCWPTDMGQTERQTDRRTAAMLNAPIVGGADRSIQAISSRVVAQSSAVKRWNSTKAVSSYSILARMSQTCHARENRACRRGCYEETAAWNWS